MKSFGFLFGRLGSVPELSKLNNSVVTRFSIAADEGYLRDGEEVKKTGWHQIEAWGDLNSTHFSFQVPRT